MTPNSNVALRLAEAFARHGVTVTFGQSLPSAFHLAAPHVGIKQAAYRQENAGGAMADGYARIPGGLASLRRKTARPPRCWSRRWRRP